MDDGFGYLVPKYYYNTNNFSYKIVVVNSAVIMLVVINCDAEIAMLMQK